MVWLSGFVKPLARLGLMQYEEWEAGQPLKILLVGYNGARNTGADARVIALTEQIKEALGAGQAELTVMTLDTDNTKGYFAESVRLFRFTTFFFFSLIRAASSHHVAVLCEGNTLTRTFADALTLFFCEAAGIMKRQGKPCIAYGSEVGHIDGWLGTLCKDMCQDTYFIARTELSLPNLEALGLKGHVGTDTAWTFQSSEGEKWAFTQLLNAGWNGRQPVIGVAVINPYCWPVRPSLGRWIRAIMTRDSSNQYDKMYFFMDSYQRRQAFHHYLQETASSVNRYQYEEDAFVVILGMEKLDADACRIIEKQIKGPHAVYTSETYDVFQMTGLLRQLSILITSRYHAAVLSMEHTIPIVAVSMDARLDGLMEEMELHRNYLHHVNDQQLADRITASLQHTEKHRTEIASTICHHLAIYKNKVEEMSKFFTTWTKESFS